MNKTNVILIVIVGVLLSVLAFGSAWMIKSQPVIQVPATQPSGLDAALAKLQPGDSIVIDEKTRTVGESVNNGKVEITGDKAYFRGMSWFGLGGPEAAALDKGIQGVNDKEGGVSVKKIGVSEGYGILEKIWNWIKSAFWTIAFIIIVLVILCFVPATAPIASSILRWIGGLIPGVGSIIEYLLGKRATTTAQAKFESVVLGGEAFKNALLADTTIDEQTKEKVKNIFRTEQQKIQDTKTQDEIKSLTA